jgi:hypothetical protein
MSDQKPQALYRWSAGAACGAVKTRCQVDATSAATSVGAGDATLSLFPTWVRQRECPELAGVSLPSVTADTKGVLGGGQVGCNYQFAPNLVIEGDGEAANIKGDVADSVSFTNPVTLLPETVSGTAHAQTDWIASVTGRLGGAGIA